MDCHCRKSEVGRSVGHCAMCCGEHMGLAVRACIECLCKGIFDVGFAGEVLAMALASSNNQWSDDETLVRNIVWQVNDLQTCNKKCNRYSRFSKLI